MNKLIESCSGEDIEEIWGVVKAGADIYPIYEKDYYHTRIKNDEGYVYKDGAWVVGAVFFERGGKRHFDEFKVMNDADDVHAICITGSYILHEYRQCGLSRTILGQAIHAEHERDSQAWFYSVISVADLTGRRNLEKTGFELQQISGDRELYIRRCKE